MNPAAKNSGENAPPATRHVTDVSAMRVARVYAESLIQAAREKGATDRVIEELGSLVEDLYPADSSFQTFLESSAVGRREKAEVVRKVFEGRASEEFLHFLLVLNDHDRLDMLPAILVESRSILDAERKRANVFVTTAVPLPDDQLERLKTHLHSMMRLEPVLHTAIDPDMLGGLKVRVGDFLYDASVQSQLNALRAQILERSSYEIQSRRDRFRSADGD